jgi:putative transposase
MPNYRRAFRPGGTFFFTLVTYSRAAFLCDPSARRILRGAIDECRTVMPFEIDAFVLLPDHLHAIWTLPDDGDFSKRWGVIKKRFTQSWIAQGGWQGDVSQSRNRNHRRGVWQRRFWEHLIRDDQDFEQHLNYIHYNPVKHGHAPCPHAWEWSSLHRWISNGTYATDWCCACNDRAPTAPNFDGLDLTAME